MKIHILSSYCLFSHPFFHPIICAVFYENIIWSWYRSFSHPIKCTICWNTAHCPILFVFSSLFCVQDFHPIICPRLWKYTYDPGTVRVSHPSSSSTRIVVLVLVSQRVCKSTQRAKVCCAFFVRQSRAFALQVRSWCFFLLCLWFPVIAASRRVSEILLLFLFLHFLAAFGVWTGKEKARSVSLVLGIGKRNSYC